MADAPQAIAAEYLDEFRSFVDAFDLDAVARAVDVLKAARDAHRTVFIAGNGGSAATATHLANDLGKATKQSGRAMMRVMCLSDNVSWLTALANDEGYDRAFAGQLENFAGTDDALIVISCSGNSPNLVEAVRMANDRGVHTIGLLGFDGGKLLDMVDVALFVESPKGHYGTVESAHAVLADLLTTCLIRDRDPDAAA